MRTASSTAFCVSAKVDRPLPDVVVRGVVCVAMYNLLIVSEGERRLYKEGSEPRVPALTSGRKPPDRKAFPPLRRLSY
jgi:hypothetical protein